MPLDNRIFYACRAIGFAKDGTQTFQNAYGVQSVGMTTSFNLENYFELGQLNLYELLEGVPEIEVTIEKILDGKSPIYHLATWGSTSATLVGRSVVKTIMIAGIWPDTFSSASGTQISEVQVSGCFVSSVKWDFPVDGAAKESVTVVANNKVWKTSAFVFAPNFLNTDTPLSGDVQRRQNVIFQYGTGIIPLDINGSVNVVRTGTVLPQDIDGISSSGTNDKDATGVNFIAPIQRISVSANLGRTPIYELGKRLPYFRYVNFPLEVSTEIEVLARQYDTVSATEAGVMGSGNNLVNRSIKVYLTDGTYLDMGLSNKLKSVTWGGGNVDGSNLTWTYSYSNYNFLTSIHPADPGGLTS